MAMRYPLLALLVLTLMVSPALCAADPAPSESVTVSETAPVAVAEPSAKALSYYHSGNVLWVVWRVWGLVVPAILLFTGFSGRLSKWSQRIGKKWFFVIAVYFVCYALIDYLANLPLAFYSGFVRQHAYGMSNQTLARWGSNSLISLGVGLVMGVLFVWVPYLLLKKSPRRWWLYLGILFVPFVFFQVLVRPVWIDPLFNDFGPMQDKQLEAKILDLADRAGIGGSRVFEVDKSADTKAVNAYVTGFLGTKRIVLWDTILDKLDEDELLFIMGHEMGHYVLNHVVMGVLFSSVVVLFGLYLIHRIAGPLIDRFGGRFGFRELSDIASLPLAVLLINFLTLFLGPVGMGFSRYIEHEADRFGLELLQDNHAAAMGFVKLQEENLSNPWPGLFYKLWRGSHPSIGERVGFFNSYRPWESGRPLVYGHHFRSD